jgi:CubicO group peptidase (beta-lactamase class C family)
MLFSTHNKTKIQGTVSPGFEGVREAFVENFERRNELGAACSAYLNGEKVVDLWGGIRNKTTGELWEKETMVVVYSTTKGLAAMTLAIAHSRGWLDYDERVRTYWPEFAQNGKGEITARQLLAHQAGLFAFDEPVDKETVADLNQLAVVLTRQKPRWEPGSRQAYHAITLGFYENELLRRVDPQHRTLGQFFQDEIASRLGEEFYIRLPEELSDSRLATIESVGLLKRLFGFPVWLALASIYPWSNIYRALVANPGSAIVHDEERIYSRELEVPSGGGVGTARAIAHAYGVFASGGKELGIRPATLQVLMSEPKASQHGFYDECMKGEAKFSLGFMKPCEAWPFHHDTAFGHPGAGGSIGFADPESGVGYAYVTNRMGFSLTGDVRDIALRDALYSAIGDRGRPLTSAASAGAAF